jgi:hypothetical protein
MHVDEVPQQSPSAVHSCCSPTQLVAHENPKAPSRQIPLQQSAGIAQLVVAVRHAASPAAIWHRCTPGGDGSGTQVSPAQQSGLPPQVSPGAPHGGGEAGWQTPIAPSAPLHTPEQQSVPEEHSSHSLRQPPSGAQRLTPPASISQSREQQSLLVPQTSPTWRVQPPWSFSMHMGVGAQCPTDCGSS